MDGKKVYQIQINGITESVNAVEALNKQLDALEKRIKTLESSNVKVNTGGGGHSSSLSEEAAVQKEINKLKAEGEKLDAKIVAAQDEVYKKVDATKQLYKETIADQKALAAQERLTADAYSNTMQGMKNHLADLKAAINVTDLGDSDKIKQMTQEANELTNKLKQMEQAYGQFGRNVGNYASAADGFKGLAIQVGDVTQEFDNAKQALKELKGEMRTLSTKKDMGLISEEEAQRLKDLIPVVGQLESSIQDAGKPMDALMDTMQSFVAIMQTTKGLSAFFGFDSTEVEKTIKNLVALQNAMQGLQTIQKQIQTREGIGAWIAPFTVQVDKATAKLLTFNTALLGTGKASKVAAVGIKTFSKALKVAFSAGVLIAVDLLVEKLMDLVENFKKVDEAAENSKKVQEEGAKAYAEGAAKIALYKQRVESFNGTKKQEKNLVEEFNKDLGEGLGTYKSISEVQKALIEKSDAYCEALKMEAEAQALLNLYTEAYVKLQKVRMANAAGENDSWWRTRAGNEAHRTEVENAAQKDADTYWEAYLAQMKKAEQHKKDNKLYDYSPQIDKSGKKAKKAIDEVQKTLSDLEMRLMKEGLNKKLRQLDEEERQTINKLKENGRKSAEAIKQVQRAYAQLRAKEIQEYLNTIEENIKQSAQNIEKIQFDIDTKTIENKITALDNKIEQWKDRLEITDNTFDGLTSNTDLEKIGRHRTDQLKESYESRRQIIKKYYAGVINDEISFIQDEKALNEERINEQLKQDRKAEQDRYTIQMSGLTKQRQDAEEIMKTIEERYGQTAKNGALYIKTSNQEILESYRKAQADVQDIDIQIETAKEQHKTKLLQITEDTNNAIKKNELDTAKEISTTQERYFDRQVANYRDLVTKINDELNRNPVMNKTWGIVDKKKTKENYDELVNAAEAAFNDIEKDKADLDRKLSEGLITDEAYEATRRNLNDAKKAIEEGYTAVLDKSANLTRDYLQSLDMYLQAFVTVLNDALGAMWDAFDRAFDEEQEQLDRENEAMQEALDKQRDMIKDHSNEIDSIEDELSTARGSRRQHLIDQLNAEMELQREAVKEKQRLDREEQKNNEQMQKKQDALDKKRRKAEYARNIAQAIINGAMAVTYAGMNTYPIPAIPMMKLAGATAAAQLAIVLANRPYAKGGLLEGPSHKQGGIPVGNTGIEVEGKEYVIRKKSTAPNMDVLDYINRSERKLDLGDFIDFYSSKVRKSISTSSPRAKFADGGALPTLSNDYSFDDRLLSAFEDYSKRPVVVSVVDINNRQNAVKNVQVLAGLTD